MTLGFKVFFVWSHIPVLLENLLYCTSASFFKKSKIFYRNKKFLSLSRFCNVFNDWCSIRELNVFTNFTKTRTYSNTLLPKFLFDPI